MSWPVRSSVDTASSLLFVPATRPERVPKALDSGAHQVIVDLEDAVGPADKDAARAALVDLDPSRPCLVRINPAGTPFHEDDLAAVAALRWLAGVIVPKVEAAADVARIAERLPAGTPVLPLVESAAAIQSVDLIATAGVARLLFGSADYLADLGVPPSTEVLAHPRSRLVVASAAAGLPSPVDGPSLRFDDPAALEAEARAVRALGFTGKFCIHPAQVQPVNRAFAYSDDEIAWARGVVAAGVAAGDGVFVYEGGMVDAPVLRRARRILGE